MILTVNETIRSAIGSQIPAYAGMTNRQQRILRCLIGEK